MSSDISSLEGVHLFFVLNFPLMDTSHNAMHYRKEIRLLVGKNIDFQFVSMTSMSKINSVFPVYECSLNCEPFGSASGVLNWPGRGLESDSTAWRRLRRSRYLPGSSPHTWTHTQREESGEEVRGVARTSWGQRRTFLLDDEGLGVEGERPQQLGGDGVMFGPGLQDQTFISRQLTVLHLLHCPFTCSQRQLACVNHHDQDQYGGLSRTYQLITGTLHLPSYFAISSSASSFLALDTTQL